MSAGAPCLLKRVGCSWGSGGLGETPSALQAVLWVVPLHSHSPALNGVLEGVCHLCKRDLRSFSCFPAMECLLMPASQGGYPLQRRNRRAVVGIRTKPPVFQGERAEGP